MHPIRHMLLGTDLTDHSRIALQTVLELGRHSSLAHLTALHVIAPNLPPTLTNAQRAAAEAHLADQRRPNSMPFNANLLPGVPDHIVTVLDELARGSNRLSTSAAAK